MIRRFKFLSPTTRQRAIAERLNPSQANTGFVPTRIGGDAYEERRLKPPLLSSTEKIFSCLLDIIDDCTDTERLR